MMRRELIFATRPSALARAQTRQVIQMLATRWEHLSFSELVITTRGDRQLDKPLPEIGGKGLFTGELEEALRSGGVHAAVHSLKDLPTEDASELVVAVIPPRAEARDVLVCPGGYSLDELPAGSVVGTSSTRRRAQLLAYRPDLHIQNIRGNVDTRIRKTLDGEYDAIVLAAAGILRLGLQSHITQYLPLEIMLPAPGQGALAVQTREDDRDTQEILQTIDHLPTRDAVTCERAFLSALGGGCSLPVGAYAALEGAQIQLDAIVAAPDGSEAMRLSASGDDPEALGAELAQKALSRGAAQFLPEEISGV